MITLKINALKFIIFFIYLSVSVSSYAQNKVNFQDLTFDEALAEAKKSNKIVFVDVRGITVHEMNKQVEKEIFTIDSVADYFNEHCVSIQMNMNSEEGKAFAQKLVMLMYPVYVFHDADGDQLEFTNSGTVLKDPAVLMSKARASFGISNLKKENSRSISFNPDNWNDLLARAKKENKLIFLDAGTEWCRPCIMMAKNVFTLNKVADFYNDNFINVSMDMEKGEGPRLGKKYKISSYPAFLYINSKGKIVHKSSGYQEADEFIKAGETATSKMKKRKTSSK